MYCLNEVGRVMLFSVRLFLGIFYSSTNRVYRPAMEKYLCVRIIDRPYVFCK